MDQQTFDTFLKDARAAQERLRKRLRWHKETGARFGASVRGGEWRDITDELIAEIENEIDIIERNIEILRAQVR